jgi:malate dehydrogenase (oxaloacetate-decarboxylating)(NADP+)
MDDNSRRVTDEEALFLHASGRPGKIEIAPTKPLTTQRDLSLAYSPGVAAPCLRIHEDPATAYDYTAKGNIVAVISNGTAVLGLGDLGALAAKPVMEGKAVLFKRFADIDGIDLEVDTRDVDEFVNCVRFLGKTFGGINLEDIRAPECFMIEQRLRELLDIPVFHDDQHGTAIVAAAGLINALDLTGRKMKDIRLVVNGAGAASIACVELLKSMGVPHEQVILCDTKGVIHEGRTDGMNQWKSAHAVKTNARSLADAMKGADVFFGLSVRGAVTPEMVASMARQPIIFAMANPDPEITPEEARDVRTDAIIATGRSDYPNQINNVLGFPYIFRGALDVRASTVNEAMKIAAAQALAELARQEVPEELEAIYANSRMRYGPEYIIPVPFDPRLISHVPPAVAKAAMDSGVARKKIDDLAVYARSLGARMDPTSAVLHATFESVRAHPRRVVFAEGEEERVVRAALAFKNGGFGTPILVGRESQIEAAMETDGLVGAYDLEVHHARLSRHNKRYADYVYKRLHRQGFLYRDCLRLVNQDRNVFAACMVALGDADALVTGVTRGFLNAFHDVTRVIDCKPGCQPFGLSMLQPRNGQTIFISDSHVHEEPSSELLADIATQSAAKARAMGHEPRVAFVSFANFGNPPAESAERVKKAMALLDRAKVDFEYDGEMSPAVALDRELLKAYPFCRLSAPANVLVMPSRDAAGIACKLMQKLGGASIVGPLLVGLEKPVQIVSMSASVSELVTSAVLAAAEVRR